MKLDPGTLDALQRFVDEQAGAGMDSEESGEMPPPPAVEVEVQPEGAMPSGKTCPTCGHEM